MPASFLDITPMNADDEPFFRALGRRIAQARRRLGLTQQQLARQLGVAQQTLAHYEGGKLRPPVSLLLPLSQALGISLGELFGDQPLRYPRLQAQFERLSALSADQQRFVSRLIDSALERFAYEKEIDKMS